MKIKIAAITATVLAIAIGIAMISPLFFQPIKANEKPKVMLAFNISEIENVDGWSKDLSDVLRSHGIGATVFIVGRVAKEYPQLLSYFDKKVDIGSQTFDSTNLTAISDYSLKLQTVKDGKEAVDSAGNIESRVFRAPYGATDQDIYSLLRRSEILADFSYTEQYNLFEGGQFVKYQAIVYNTRDYPPDFFSSLSKTSLPIIVFFDEGYPVSAINSIILNLKKAGFGFVNASELTGIDLTIRRGETLVNRTIASN